MNEKIKAILFESNDVLVRPVTGHWFIPPNFFQFIKPVNYEHVRNIEREAAFAQASEQLAFYPLVRTMEEEYNVFVEYYRMFFICIPRLKATPEQVEGIARDLVFNPEKFEFLSDAMEVIQGLARRCKLAVVAEGWPSLEDVFTHAGMRHQFSAFVISRQSGQSMPDPCLFQTALDELGVNPREALYVDDSNQNCNAARRMGFQTALLCRDGAEFVISRLINRNHRVIRSLMDLPALIA